MKKFKLFCSILLASAMVSFILPQVHNDLDDPSKLPTTTQESSEDYKPFSDYPNTN